MRLIATALAFAAYVGWGTLPTLVAAQTQSEDGIVWGCEGVGYSLPTTEYAHGVLGDDVEYKGLHLLIDTSTGSLPATFELPAGQVYEDIAPRCGDLNGNGENEIVTVVSDATGGARVVIYSKKTGPIDETPPIGRGYRWLAPIAIADVDGDGQNDISYVETPHLGGTLRVWTLKDGKLTQIAEKRGFSNHRIGEDFITGGARDCGDGTELIVPDFDWNALLAVRWQGGTLVQRSIANTTDLDTVQAALDCKLK